MINLNLRYSKSNYVRLHYSFALSTRLPVLLFTSICFLVFSVTNDINAQSVSTDKPDYSPKETAYIIAKGFQKGEEAVFQVMHIDGKTNNGNGHEPWNVIDGSKYDLDGKVDGNIKTSWYVDPDDSFNSTFELCAQGRSSGLQATWKFLDDTPVPTSVTASYNSNTDVLTVDISWQWVFPTNLFKVVSVAVYADLDGDGNTPEATDNPSTWTMMNSSPFDPEDEFLGQQPNSPIQGNANGDETADGIGSKAITYEGLDANTPRVLFPYGLNPQSDQGQTGSFTVTYSGVTVQPQSICVILFDIHTDGGTTLPSGMNGAGGSLGSINDGTGNHSVISAEPDHNGDNSLEKGFDQMTVNCTDPLGSFIFPVELANFEVIEHNATATIKWTTANEIESDFFEIQRSRDGYTFEKIGEIQAQGTSQTLNNYSFKDMRPIIGNNYYRLKMVDTDGAFEYSSIEVINISAQNADGNYIKYFPNPTTGDFSIDIQGYGNGKINVEIINSVGIIVGSKLVESNNKISMSHLPQGVYYIRAIDANKNLINIQKIVKIY